MNLLFPGGKLGTLEGGIPSCRSLGNHLMPQKIRNLVTYENKLVTPTALSPSHYGH